MPTMAAAIRHPAPARSSEFDAQFAWPFGIWVCIIPSRIMVVKGHFGTFTRIWWKFAAPSRDFRAPETGMP